VRRPLSPTSWEVRLMSISARLLHLSRL
jgi:hypothetical protein